MVVPQKHLYAINRGNMKPKVVGFLILLDKSMAPDITYGLLSTLCGIRGIEEVVQVRMDKEGNVTIDEPMQHWWW